MRGRNVPRGTGLVVQTNSKNVPRGTFLQGVAQEKLFHVEQLCWPLHIDVSMHNIAMICEARGEVLCAVRPCFSSAKTCQGKGARNGSDARGWRCNANHEKGVPPAGDAQTRLSRKREKERRSGQWLCAEGRRGAARKEWARLACCDLHQNWCTRGGEGWWYGPVTSLTASSGESPDPS